jgi:hypothetical protein
MANRREFLALSASFLIFGCANESKGSPSVAGVGTAAPLTSPDGFTIAQRFSQDVLVPGPVRLPISLANSQALLSDGPAVLRGTIYDTVSGKPVAKGLTAKRRRVSEAFVYWDFRAQLDKPGTYALVVDGGTPEGGAIQINEPARVQIPTPGQVLPPVETPTTQNSRGVDPICTRLEGGPCPFHEVTLTEALKMGKPVAYLIGTPAHCQFGTCAPGLEFLIAASRRLGDRIMYVHAEVYTDDSATITTPAVDAYNLSFEPTVFLTNANGTIFNRLDAAWDQSELDEVLDELLASA